MSSGVVLKNVNGSRRSSFIVSLALSFVFMLPCLFFVVEDLGGGVAAASIKRLVVLFSKENTCINTTTTTTATAAALCGPGRKLLQSADGDGDGDGDGGGGDMNRVGTACSKDDITIFQGETAPLPNGIPAYTVEILNMCVSGCSISNIHINCGWFSSARLVNPTVFRRMDYDDCLVNDGQPLGPGQTLSFQYANTFRYPLSVSSVAC